MGPFKAGVRASVKLLDECHGAIDETTGEYRTSGVARGVVLKYMRY